MSVNFTLPAVQLQKTKQIVNICNICYNSIADIFMGKCKEMGAYGSPELKAPDSQFYRNYGYGYSNPQYQNYQKPKKHWGIFFGGFFVGAAFAFLTLLCVASNEIQTSKSVQTTVAVPYTNSVPAQNGIYTTSNQIEETELEKTLKKKAEEAVKKYYSKPESITFSDDSNNWNIREWNNQYDISFYVTIKNSLHQMQKTLCGVTISFDGKNYKLMYVDIDGHLAYDYAFDVSSATSQKSSNKSRK